MTDFFLNASRHCPGSDEMTRRVLKQIRLKNPEPSVIDLGFGTGEQTLELIRRYNVPVIAFEQNPGYALPFAGKVEKLGLGHMVEICGGCLEKLPYGEHAFDLILSEGGIRYLDFCQRIHLWRPFLKPGGYLALSELCLRTDKELPDELYEYLETAFPWKEIDTAESLKGQIREAGYKLCGQFPFPDDCWMRNYYREMQGWYEDLPDKKKNSRQGGIICRYIEESIYMYMMYREYFGYVYFILRKPES